MKHVVWLVGLSLLGGCVETEISPYVNEWPNSGAPRVPDEQVTDRIMQVVTPKVDVLFVIDDSCSMGVYQNQLGDNFPAFMEFFSDSGLDYHIGVTSTDLTDSGLNGRLKTTIDGKRWIDNATNQPGLVFDAMVNLGSGGSGTEKGMGALFKCLEELGDKFNAGFYRDEASLHSVTVSDEPEQTKSGYITKNEFIDWYDGLKQTVDERSYSSIVTTTGFSKGTTYMDITDAIGGVVWDIENDNWVLLLEELGVRASGFKREYYLSQLPVQGTISVGVLFNGVQAEFVEGTLEEGDNTWTYNEQRNSITFNSYTPDAQAEVLITYTLLAALQDGEADPPEGTN